MALRRGVSSLHRQRSFTSDLEYDLDEDDEGVWAELLDDVQAERLVTAPALSALSQGNVGLETCQLDPQELGPAIDIQYDDLLDESFTVPKEGSPGHQGPEYDPINAPDDGRSPLARFRTAPKKPLSVTDLVSPAWCELQYWYSLTKHGRVKKTPAMKRGSKVHKVLEKQVHVEVPVKIQTREDHWGIKLWNIIQGLRTLRTTGMTREFEVWGTIDGQVINGVIDELSYSCPDPDLEAKLETSQDSKKTSKDTLAPDQASISEFFQAQRSAIATQQAPVEHTPRKIYLTDVKTRGSARMPSGASLRPTHMQLMLYHKLLSDMAAGLVDPSIIFARYRLNADLSFSDSLIRQLSTLDMPSSNDDTATDDNDNPHASLEADVDTVTELLSHNSLTALWSLVLSELALTIPSGALTIPTSGTTDNTASNTPQAIPPPALTPDTSGISPLLRAEFRSATTSAIIGSRTFTYSAPQIDSYISEELSWWKGERAARGVDVEEAFKCRVCEFAESCEWRLGKIEEAVGRSRESRERSGARGREIEREGKGKKRGKEREVRKEKVVQVAWYKR